MATTHVIMFKDGDPRVNNSGLENSGSHVNQILTYHPTDKQLNKMRDGLLRLNKRAGVARN
ncbi:MAG TPA: hypothetical protein VGJ42_04070 [Nitrososphaera sp.]